LTLKWVNLRFRRIRHPEKVPGTHASFICFLAEVAILQGPRYACAVDRDEILRVLQAFEQEGLEYVLIGAAAMGFHRLCTV